MFSMLDLRLGARMLFKHPALSVTGVIAVAFLITVGSIGFEVARQMFWPTVTLPHGEEIVEVRAWDVAGNDAVPVSFADYVHWRDSLGTITDLSAVELEERSVAVGSGPGLPVTVANVTPSTFELTRVPAALGRTLFDGEEAVVVVGHDFWQDRLDGAADAIGRVIRISGEPVTVVGVMPPGFGFPLQNAVWRPLGVDAAQALTHVFGRLAPDHSYDQAAAELDALGARERDEAVRLQLRSLPEAVSPWPTRAALVMTSLNVFIVLLAALLCGNVAMLLFARAVTRERELLVRTALGASRGRLVTQLFTEALLLCAVGAAVGLLVARPLLARTWAIVEEQAGALPFWIGTSLSPTTVAYAAGLTLVAAAIAGVLPALKVTSGRAGGRLQAASAGAGGLQFGGVWTVVIVAQVALMTMLPVPLLGVGADVTRETPAGFPAEQFLTATLDVDRVDGEAGTERAQTLAARYHALAERLREEPGVLDVTYADQMPLMRTRWQGIAMDDGPLAQHDGPCKLCAGIVAVDPRFFEAVGAPVIAGRALTATDVAQGNAVLVNEFFVEHALGGSNPVGRHYRLWNGDTWFEVVGVVPDLGVNDNRSDYGRARIYHPISAGEAGPLRLAIHVRGDPQAFVPRLRELAQATDPALRVIDPMPMLHLKQTVSAYWLALLVAFTALTLMLSLAGVYAVTSFAVAKRTREIGVRVALGASPSRIVAAVFKRPMVQIALGVGIGAVFAIAMANNDLADIHLDDLASTAGFALATIVCCALACIVPTRRALHIQPSEALKDE